MDKTEKQLEKVEKLFGMINEDFVKPEELKEVVESVLEAVKGVKDTLEQKIADSNGELSDSLENVLYDLKDKQIKLESLILKSREFTLAETRSVAKQLNQEVNRLEDLIPLEVDLSSIERKIADLEKRPIPVPEDMKAEKIRDRLESLKGDERLDISAIKGIGKRLSELSDAIINRAIGILDSRTSFLIAKVSNLEARVNALVVSAGGQVNSVVAGTNITVDNTDPANPIVSSTASGSGFTLLPATGSINSVNAAFTFTEKPDYIISDGAWYRENKGWTWSVLTATMTIPPSSDIYGFT